MTRSSVRRVAVLFVLTLLVAAPWSHAAPRQERGAAPATVLGQLWTRLTSLWGDIGCGADPGGRCQFSVTSDIGCGLDPHGRCQASVTSDIGCGADPHGCGQ
jgi:hypothetical protein